MTRLRPDNPMVKVFAMTLIFEAIVFILAIPGMIQVSDRPVGLAIGVGGAAVVLALASVALLRKGIGWELGWLTQVVGVLLGLLTPMQFIMGGVFAALWVAMFILGKRMEASRG